LAFRWRFSKRSQIQKGAFPELCTRSVYPFIFHLFHDARERTQARPKLSTNAGRLKKGARRPGKYGASIESQGAALRPRRVEHSRSLRSSNKRPNWGKCHGHNVTMFSKTGHGNRVRDAGKDGINESVKDSLGGVPLSPAGSFMRSKCPYPFKPFTSSFVTMAYD
jgi:hypothetical protein